MPAAAHRSQPEFDFEDEEPGAVAPAVIDHSTPKDAHLAEPMSVRPAAFAAQAVEPAVQAQPGIVAPVDAMPVDTTPMEAMPMEAAAAVANIEPAATEPQGVDIETTPTASIEPTASAPDEVESASIEPAMPMFAEIEPQATDNAASASASASAAEAAVADVIPMPAAMPAPSPGLFDMLPNAPVIDIDPAEEAAKAVAHVNEAADGADNETARNA
jgi:ribonuclease E